MPETVLYTICYSDYYGTQQNVVSTVRSLDRSRYRPVVAAPYGEHFVRELERSDTEFVDLPFLNLFDVKTAAGIAAAARRRRASIIHAHLGISTLLSLAASRMAGGVPVVATRHFIKDRYSTISNPLTYNVFRKTYISMDRMLKKVIFVSEAARKSVEKREGDLGEKGVVIPNAIDVENSPRRDRQSRKKIEEIRTRAGVPQEKFVVISLSRLSPEKDIPTLLRAASLLKKQGKDFFFIITGDGPMKRELEKTARELDVHDCVKFTGFITEKETLISASDAFVLCSSVDSFGISVLEAMAGCVPAISARGGGPLEIITEGEDGLFFPPGDSEELAGLLSRLAEDENFARRLAENGSARAADFDERKITTRIQEVYDEVLEGTK
ncbi:glycosyltransferase family 4 protein [bacterium]